MHAQSLIHYMLNSKMKNNNIITKFLVYNHVTFIIFILSGHLICIHAKIHHRKHVKSTLLPPTMAANIADHSNSNTFNVMDYGASGDGTADDTDAFVKAWAEACKVEDSTMLVPPKYTFLVKPTSFSGKCQSNIVLQLEGTIIAPTYSGAWSLKPLQWLDFTGLDGLTIQGNGVIDGQGSVWWKINDYTTTYDIGGMPDTKPTALRVADSTSVTVTGIKIQNSQQEHLKFDNCNGVKVYSIIISSPGDSPNTDGIHLQNSQDVLIHDSNIACGDDCISMQTGSCGVNIYNVNCGPSHGISIGGLGEDGSKACVSNITVRDSKISDSLTGVRIKTWQGGSGSVQGVMFSNIQVSEVKTPIVIDQYYSNVDDGGRNKSSAVAVSAITYESITGSYIDAPLYLACSDSKPCAGLTLSDIVLNPSQGISAEPAICYKAFGELETATTSPAITHCLQKGDSSSHKQSYIDGSC